MNKADKDSLQEQARALLESNDEAASLDAVQTADVARLVEQMQIYQAELEVQNQQLRDTQEQLDQQQTQYKNLFEHLPMPALVVNQQGLIEQNNDQASQFFAHRATRYLQHHSIYRFISEELGQWLLENFQNEALSTSLAGEFMLPHKQGAKPVKTIFMPLKQTKTAPSLRQFVVLFIDLTAEYQHQKDWQTFQALLDHSSVFIYAFDRDGHCVLANKKMAALFGYQQGSALIGKKREQLMSAEDAQQHLHNDLVVWQSKASTQVKETLFLGQQWRYFLTDKFPLFDHNHAMYAVGGVTYDITLQTQQEKKLRLSNEIFNKGQDGIMICDPAGRILSVNEAFTKITGYTFQECLGKNPNMLSSGRHSEAFYEHFWQTLLNEDMWRGEIWNRRKSGEIYPQQLTVSVIRDEGHQIVNFLAVFNDISAKKEAEEEIAQLALYDSLTGVANRSLLKDRIDKMLLEASRQSVSLSLMFIDLDNFKDVNDVYGHDAGDALLKNVAERIGTVIRSQDTLARLGGDEFAILLPYTDQKTSLNIAQRLITVLAKPYEINQNMLHSSASIGIAFYPDDAQTYATLLKHADLAMYQAKHLGRNGVHLFKPALATDLASTVNLENDLRFAIEKQQLHCVLQPQYSLKTKQFVGAEALLRWQHPKLGWIAPDQFIPIAERSDLIMDLTDWVVKQALEFLHNLPKGYEFFSLAVNISPREFWRSDFVTRIQTHLEAHPTIGAHRLELELTERLAMHNHAELLAVLNDLRQLGVRLSIDDFGTGYSSLSHLKHYPLQMLKIDKSFVDDVALQNKGQAICEAIINLAQAIEFNTLAEGVEDAKQVAVLEQLGCDLIQGYYFAKPMPLAQARDFITKPVS